MSYEDQAAAAARADAGRAAAYGSVADQMAANQRLRDAEGRSRNANARWGSASRSSSDVDIGGLLLLGAVALALLSLTFAVVLFAGLWMTLHTPLRFLFEHSPLSGSVAQQAHESGNPLLVAGVVAVPVLVALIAVSTWRRRVVGRALQTASPRRSIYLASLLRTLALFAGLGLVLTSVGIAIGGDLPEGNFVVKPPGSGEEEAAGSGSAGDVLFFLGLALGAIATYTFLSARRVWNKMASRF